MVSEIRYMRNALTENKVFPSTFEILFGYWLSGSVLKLRASDNDYIVFESQSLQGGNEQRVEVVFIGTHSGHMPFLQIQYEAKASINVGHSIRAYNYATGEWESVNPSMYLEYSLTTSDVTKWLFNLLNSRNYRNSSGEWKIKVAAATSGTPAPSFTIYIDYLHYRTVAFQLGTEQTASLQQNDVNLRGQTVGIRVWKVNSDDSETEITLGSIVATVVGPGSTTILSNTWNCPETADAVAVVVRLFRQTDILKELDLASGYLPFVFITEDINSTLLNAIWTVYYAFYYEPSIRWTSYSFGTSTYNSRIENFGYGVPAVAVPFGDGWVWVS